MIISHVDWLQALRHEQDLKTWRDGSKPGKYKVRIISHDIEPITRAQWDWYFRNFDTDTYVLWHPSHKGVMWEARTAEEPIHIAWESINGTMAAYRIRISNALRRAPEAGILHHGEEGLVEMLDAYGKPCMWDITQFLPSESGRGFRLIDNFVFPEAAPDRFADAHAAHCREEVEGLTKKAIPTLIQRVFGYMADADALERLPDIHSI